MDLLGRETMDWIPLISMGFVGVLCQHGHEPLCKEFSGELMSCKMLKEIFIVDVLNVTNIAFLCLR